MDSSVHSLGPALSERSPTCSASLAWLPALLAFTSATVASGHAHDLHLQVQDLTLGWAWIRPCALSFLART
eukprot:5084725-Amphidinium_carterae.1